MILYCSTRGSESTQQVVNSLEEGKEKLIAKLHVLVPHAAECAMREIDVTGKWSNGFITVAIL